MSDVEDHVIDSQSETKSSLVNIQGETWKLKSIQKVLSDCNAQVKNRNLNDRQLDNIANALNGLHSNCNKLRREADNQKQIVNHINNSAALAFGSVISAKHDKLKNNGG